MEFQNLIKNVCSSLPVKHKVEKGDIILILNYSDSFFFNWAIVNKIEKAKKEYLNLHFRILSVPLVDTCWMITEKMLNGKEIFTLDETEIKRFIVSVETKEDPDFDFSKIDKTCFVVNPSKYMH